MRSREVNDFDRKDCVQAVRSYELREAIFLIPFIQGRATLAKA
jgi:hypothetical protein